jgi:hypothetical protein
MVCFLTIIFRRTVTVGKGLMLVKEGLSISHSKATTSPSLFILIKLVAC